MAAPQFSRFLAASWAVLLVSAAAIVQPVFTVGGASEAIWTSMGATAAAIILAATLRPQALFTGKAARPDVDGLIGDLAACAEALHRDGPIALAQSKYGRSPDLKYGLALLGRGLEPHLVRAAIERRMEGGPGVAGPLAGKIAGTVLMFVGSAGLMLIQPTDAAAHAPVAIALLGSLLGGMAVLGLSHMLESPAVQADSSAGLAAALLIEGVVGLASGTDPIRLKSHLRRIAAGDQPVARAA